MPFQTDNKPDSQINRNNTKSVSYRDFSGASKVKASNQKEDDQPSIIQTYAKLKEADVNPGE